MVGSQGLKEILSISSMYDVSGEILLPILLYVCANCGKIEFMAKKKTKNPQKKLTLQFWFMFALT